MTPGNGQFDPAAAAPDAAAGSVPSTSRDILSQLDAAWSASARLGELVRENESLADEVLRTYEQLNLLLDVTQQVSAVTRRADIESVLLRRLGRMLRAPVARVADAAGALRAYATDEASRGASARAFAPDQELAACIAQCREARSVGVRTLGSRQVLLGALARLRDQVDVVFVERSGSADPFTSGDLRLTETLLTFGSQIICNAELHERLRHVSMETTRALVSAIDKKDRYTSGHSERVGFLSRLVGEHLQLPLTELEQLEWAGLLHDVGKIGVPEEVLNKPGKLTDEEFAQIKKHPEMGYEILRPIQSFQEILDGVLYHHENPDGTGYPRGLKGDAIPLAARIIHVVDVFDALSSSRSYRARFSIEQALSILRKEAGTVLDAEIVRVFLEAFEALRRDRHVVFAAAFPHLGDEIHGAPA